MTEASYPVPAEWAKDALIDAAAYDRMYAEAATDPVEADPGHLRGGEGKGEVRGLRQHGA